VIAGLVRGPLRVLPSLFHCLVVNPIQEITDSRSGQLLERNVLAPPDPLSHGGLVFIACAL
jgi:hypothetical protein